MSRGFNLPPAGQNPFEKGFRHLPKLLIKQKFFRGSKGGGFTKKPPLKKPEKKRAYLENPGPFHV
jgi:hypothetical protein